MTIHQETVVTRPRPNLDPLYTCVTAVIYPGNGGHATGVYFIDDRDDLYLVTNRHVVSTENDDPIADRIRIITRPSRNLDDVQFHDVDLTRGDEHRWRGHPSSEEIDLAAIPLDIDLSDQATTALTSERLINPDVVPMAQRALVLGYPMIEGAPYFPIKRDAMIASPYGISYRGMPCFKTDADMHSGTSGSPVFALPDPSMAGAQSDAFRLIGIHSATLTSQHGPQEGALDLNITWYAELLADLVSLDGY